MNPYVDLPDSSILRTVHFQIKEPVARYVEKLLTSGPKTSKDGKILKQTTILNRMLNLAAEMGEELTPEEWTDLIASADTEHSPLGIVLARYVRAGMQKGPRK